MEQVKIQTDTELVTALQKMHECQVVYLNAMAKYDDAGSLDAFITHSDCVASIIKQKIADDIESKIENEVENKYE